MFTAIAIEPLKAYHGDPSVKAFYLERVRKHREADELRLNAQRQRTMDDLLNQFAILIESPLLSVAPTNFAVVQFTSSR